MRSKYSKNKRIVAISNRLPVTIQKRKGNINILQSPGGLSTGLRSLQSEKKVIFVGWPGYIPENPREQKYVEDVLISQHQCFPVFLTRTELDKYYYGFSNRTLWPLFHYFSSYCTFDENDWKIFKKVNQKFSKKVIEITHPKDIFWIHDYLLMLLPQLIRAYYPESAIGFFLHIPFPSSEIFRILPWRNEILQGLLGADLVGFHTYEYARHFLSSTLRLLGYENEFGTISLKDRSVKVENFPMGIDAKKIENLIQKTSTQKDINKLKKSIAADDKTIILSVDRLDYTKGIPQRLKAFESFLSRNSEWHNKIIYIMVCVPSRTKVRDYFLLKQEVDRLIGKINGRFGNPNWMPVHYLYKSFPFEKLLPLYAAADIALVTPIRDGMNLVAKEYVAAKTQNLGVLILSETAGAADELSEALVININSKEEIVNALSEALNMPEQEKAKRMKAMRHRILEYDINHWIQSFITSLEETKASQAKRECLKLSGGWKTNLFTDYSSGKNRLLFLDYDGTLITFSNRPEEAKPDIKLKRILLMIAKNPKNMLVIISGRDRQTMEQWLGDIPCSLIAEHGAWLRSDGKSEWKKQKTISSNWKDQIKPILKSYEARVPGSFVEIKEFGLVWHYRKSNPDLGKMRSCELFDNLNELLANTELQVIHGKKVIEVRPLEVNKGTAINKIINQKKWDFIIAIGDDWTDEDMFRVLPPSAYSIKIGYSTTKARFFLESPQECRDFLHKLTKK